MALPDGAHYVTGTGRRLVRLADGTTVSRTTAENMQVAARGIPGVTNTYQQRKLRLFGRSDRGREVLGSDTHRQRSELAARLRDRRDAEGRPAPDPRAVDP